MYDYLLKKCIYPLMELYFGTKTLSNLEYLKKTQWYTPAQIQNLQNKRLRILINHAYKNVPYYHQLFNELNLTPADIKTTDDLIKLPLLTKKDIRNNFDSLVAQNIPKSKLLYKTTGGSTGIPLRFARDKASMGHVRAAQYRFFEWAGLDFFGDKWISLTASLYDDEIFRKIQAKAYLKLMRQKRLPTFGVNDRIFAEYTETIKNFSPKVLYGYSSSLYLFSKFLENNNICLNVSSAISDSETLHPHYRQTIEKQLNCKVFDHYGSKEATYAQECDNHSGYHIAIENVFLEFIDNNGKRVNDGEIGSILVTDYTNLGMPLIRYENGDLGIPTSKKCECGRSLPLIHSIVGRKNDILVTKDGKLIPSTLIPDIFQMFEKDIQKYQVIQTHIDKLELLLVKKKTYNEQVTEAIKKSLYKYFNDDCTIHINYVDSIKTPPSGKHRVVISQVYNNS